VRAAFGLLPGRVSSTKTAVEPVSGLAQPVTLDIRPGSGTSGSCAAAPAVRGPFARRGGEVGSRRRRGSPPGLRCGAFPSWPRQTPAVHLGPTSRERNEESRRRQDARRLDAFILSAALVDRPERRVLVGTVASSRPTLPGNSFVSVDDGRVTAFLRWGEVGWPPTSGDTEVLGRGTR